MGVHRTPGYPSGSKLDFSSVSIASLKSVLFYYYKTSVATSFNCIALDQAPKWGIGPKVGNRAKAP